MKHFWTIGHPFGACYSTPVLQAVFNELGVECTWETHDLPPEEYDDFIAKLKSGELDGAVVASPYKTPSIEHMDMVTGTVEQANALNLIVRKPDGQLSGHNTNGHGATLAVRSVFPDITGMKVLIVGAGGAARAAAYKMKKHGAEVSIWNRTVEKAQKCAEELGIEWVEDMRKWDGRPQIIINSTSVSRQAKQKTLVPFALWEKVEFAMDAVSGGTSLFLEEAQAAGVEKLFSGEEWFIGQIIEAADRFLGKSIDKALVERIYKEVQPA